MSAKSGKQPANLLKLDSTCSPHLCLFLCGSSHRPKQKANWELDRRSSSECLLVFLCSKAAHLFWLLVCFRPKMAEIDSTPITHPCHPERSRSSDRQ